MHNSNNSALSKDTIFGASNHTDINSVFNSPSSLEYFSVAKAKEVLTKNLLAPREAMQVLSNLEAAQEANKIFNERKATESPKTFTQISAREAFIEEQVERANLYNIPYKTYGDNYYGLMVDIDKYEYLLEKAEDLGIYFDTSEYDPVALEQEIEEHKESERRSNNLMYSDYYSSRRVAV
jgi:hypothetical protein